MEEELIEFIEKFNISVEELSMVRPDTSIECKTGRSPLYYVDLNITRGCKNLKKYNLF